MIKFDEMDKNIKLKDQLEEKITGSVILINKFNVDPDGVDQLLEAWASDAAFFKQQPGFISTQMHRGIGKSSVFINYAVWESTDLYKNAINKYLSPETQSQLVKYPDSAVGTPHLFKKIAVPGLCVD